MKVLLLTATLLFAGLAVAPADVVDTAQGCFYVYTRSDVGQLSIVRRSSCAPPEPYWCPYEGAPLERCERIPG